MKAIRSRQRPSPEPFLTAGVWGGGLFLILLLCACSDMTFFKAPATPEPVGSVHGAVHAWVEGTPINGRRIVLCRSIRDPREGNCELMDRSVETNQLGHFQIVDVPVGTYFILYDSGLSDFDEAMARWGGKTLHFGQKEWLSEFLGVDLENETPTFRIPEGIRITPHEDWLRPYCVLTLLVGNSPFIIAHDLDLVQQTSELQCKFLTVDVGMESEIDIQVVRFSEEQAN